jgi:hypothetical protein
MRRYSSRNYVVLFFGLLLGLYHGLNVARGKFLSFRDHWTRAQLTLGPVNARWMQWRIPIEAEREDFTFTPFVNGKLVHSDITGRDAASREVALAGYSLRYLAGQIRNDMVGLASADVKRIFWREELPFMYADAIPAVDQGFSRPLKHLGEMFAQRGVTFIAVPVPLKVSFERERFPQRLPSADIWTVTPPKIEDPRLVYRTIVDGIPDDVVDVYSLFESYRKNHPDEDLYVPADSHWSSLGIALAAQGVIEKLRTKGWHLDAPKLKPAGRDEPQFDHDLIRHTQLYPQLAARLPDFQWREPLYVINPVSALPDSSRRIVVVGDSCSHRLHDRPYGLGALLSAALQIPHVDKAATGGVAVDAYNDLLNQDFHLKYGDILVFEFSLRKPWPSTPLSPLTVDPIQTNVALSN